MPNEESIMGDRCNIVVSEKEVPNGASLKGVIDKGVVVLYGHWGGKMMPRRLQIALAKRWRWTDGAYLARIIFDAFTAGFHGEETGFGILTELGDNEHPVMVVDVPSNKVRMFGKGGGGEIHAWTLKEYVDASLDSIMEIYNV